MRALALLALAAALLLLVGTGSRTQAAGPTPNGYSLALFATAPELNQIVDLAIIPGQEDDAIVASQTDDLLWRISLTAPTPASCLASTPTATVWAMPATRTTTATATGTWTRRPRAQSCSTRPAGRSTATA